MLQKRLEYGFNGYQVPFIPRAARSARRRGTVRKKVENNEMCAFDLLATVAGKLLFEVENSHDQSNGNDQPVNIQDIVEKQLEEGYVPNVGHCDQGSTGTASLTLELALQGQDQRFNVKEISDSHHGASSAPASVITLSDCLEKDDSREKMGLNNDKSEGELDGSSLGRRESHAPDMDEHVQQHECPGKILLPNGTHLHSSEDPKFFDRKPPVMVNSDSSVKLSSGKDHYPRGLAFTCRNNNVKVVARDDDENSSECSQPSAMKVTRVPARLGDRRIRKLLASKYWRVAPKVKDGDLSGTEIHCVHRSRKTGYKRQRSQRIYPFKKRKFYHYTSLSNSDMDTGRKHVCNSHDNAIDATAPGSGAVGRGVNGSSSCVAGQNMTFLSEESHVKLRIKSFRVPELFIEMPETVTIGSLKRTVLEAVTALFGGGLRVGVLLQGKKVRDDNRTLLESGICHDDKLGSLCFTLDPNPSHVSAPVCSQDSSLLLTTDEPQPLSRCPATSVIHQGASHLPPDHPMVNIGNLIESDHDSAPSPAEISAEKGTVDSRALVALPEGTPQALTVVPSHQKSKRSEMTQRRIRRPFSVTEVEALVQAVEKLGTGRWRDVKLRAFDSVKHRTYVDLKDKWKTLVHTARISPQQRRGEPVPQELLDRVLAAHAYWSQQQAKQQLKQHSDACLLL